MGNLPGRGNLSSKAKCWKHLITTHRGESTVKTSCFTAINYLHVWLKTSTFDIQWKSIQSHRCHWCITIALWRFFKSNHFLLLSLPVHERKVVEQILLGIFSEWKICINSVQTGLSVPHESRGQSLTSSKSLSQAFSLFCCINRWMSHSSCKRAILNVLFQLFTSPCGPTCRSPGWHFPQTRWQTGIHSHPEDWCNAETGEIWDHR